MSRSKVIFLVVLLALALSAMLSADRFVTNTPMPTRVDRATISVTDLTGTLTPTDMVNSILGGGVTPSNVVYTGSGLAAGVFSGGTQAGLGINQGIILSSGSALYAIGPNTTDGASYGHDLPGDTDLSTLIGGVTNDACVLEFDFVPTSANFQFTFVMGSEEYEEYLEYADVFAFYLNGVNIALIPSTTTPIAISTINQNVNTAYYISNYPFPGTYDIQCDGFTIPISLNATVIPNVTNHIKLAVADFTDTALDTWIFINGGSFTSGYNVYVDSDPAGATIFKDGINTGLLTPATILQATGTTSEYYVQKTGQIYSPTSSTVANITSDQSLMFYGTPEGFTYEVNAFDLAWYEGMGYEFPILFPPVNDPNDVNAEILLNGVSFTPPVYTPYIFGIAGNEPFVPGTYSVVLDPPYNAWQPESVTFFDIITNYATDFLGFNEDETPVELSAFTATLTAQNYVQLTWTSQTETNMLGYQVYRNESSEQANSILITPIMIAATNTSSQQTYGLTDTEVESGHVYYYWLECVDINSSSFHGPMSISVTGELPPVVPEISSMSNAYPNPFKVNSSTTIDVAVKAGETGTVTIYNLAGQAVRSFEVTEGTHNIVWNGKDSKGNVCGSGVYFYKLSTPSFNVSRKMVIVK